MVCRTVGEMDGVPLRDVCAVWREINLFDQWIPAVQEARVLRWFGPAEFLLWFDAWVGVLYRDVLAYGFGVDLLHDGKLVIMCQVCVHMHMHMSCACTCTCMHMCMCMCHVHVHVPCAMYMCHVPCAMCQVHGIRAHAHTHARTRARTDTHTFPSCMCICIYVCVRTCCSSR